MRSLVLLSLASTLVVPLSALAAQGSFEGVVVLRMTGRDTDMSPVYYIKGGRTRIEMDAGGNRAVQLMDMSKGTMTALMPEQKMYLTMDFGGIGKGLEQAQAGKGSKAPSDPGIRFEATGQREVIAGIPCEHFRIVNAREQTEMDMCLAKGMGIFMGMAMDAGAAGGMGGGKQPAGVPPEIRDLAARLSEGAFLLKSEMKEKGKVTMTMLATRVERKALSDDLFLPPPDYRPFDMKGMMRPRKP